MKIMLIVVLLRRVSDRSIIAIDLDKLLFVTNVSRRGTDIGRILYSFTIL